MKTSIPFLIALVSLSCSTSPEAPEQTVIDRIEWLYDMKPMVEKQWPGFGDPQFDVPLVYYTDSACYAANPTGKFLDAYPAALKVSENRNVRIYKTTLPDAITFHMSVSMSLGDPDPAPGADWDYRSPFMLCSGFEITQNTIPDLESIEEWATMVMHEYFHGFQFRHPQYLERFEQIVLRLPPQDTLKRLYKNNDWFAKSINSENDALLAALGSADESETVAQVNTFFRLREARRERTRLQFGFDPAPLERFYETTEGTARAVEWMISCELGSNDPSAGMPAWLCRTDKTTWYYASGLNLTRLLDTLGIEYHERLFNEGTLSLEQILQSRI